MNEKPLKHLLPGVREIRTVEHNRALDRIERTNTVSAEGSQVDEGQRGVSITTYRKFMQIKITGGSNPYSWTEVFIDPDNPTKLGLPNFVVPSNPETGTTIEIPAIERSGNTTVPIGTVVRAEIDYSSSTRLFDWPLGSGGVNSASVNVYLTTLPAYTVSGATNNILTGNSSGPLGTLNGVAMILGTTFLLDPSNGGQTTGSAATGVYVVTNPGNGGAFVAQRIEQAQNALINVGLGGTVGANTLWQFAIPNTTPGTTVTSMAQVNISAWVNLPGIVTGFSINSATCAVTLTTKTLKAPAGCTLT